MHCFLSLLSLFDNIVGIDLIIFSLHVQFGQVGAGDNIDHCSPIQIKFPQDQVHPCYLAKNFLSLSYIFVL